METTYLHPLNITLNKSTFLFESDQQTEATFIELFEFYYTPLLVYIGIFGNILSMYVFFATKLKNLSSTYYLGALAISDSGFLISLFGVWLKVINIDVFNRPVFCQLIVYSTSVCSFLSVWLVVSFTVERFVAVRYPLLRQSVCTVSRARLTVIILTIIAATVFLPLLIFATAEVDPDRKLFVCRMNQQWQNLAGAFNAIDTIVTFIIPVIVIAVLNGCISRTVWKLAKVRRRLTGYGFDNISGGRPTTSMKNVFVAQLVGGDTKNILQPQFNDMDTESNDGHYSPVNILTEYDPKTGCICPRLSSSHKLESGEVTPNIKLFRHRKIKGTSSSQTKVTKMLLVVSSVFLGLNLPSYVMRILAYLIEYKMIDGINFETFVTIQHCCLQFFYTSFGINFLLYCSSGQNFRRALRTSICPGRHRRAGTSRSRTDPAAGLTGTTNMTSESRTHSSGSSISFRRRGKTSRNSRQSAKETPEVVDTPADRIKISTECS